MLRINKMLFPTDFSACAARAFARAAFLARHYQAAQHVLNVVVMATHARAGIRRLAIGSVAEKVVRMAPCPVFTVKNFGKPLIAPGAHAGAGETA